MARKKFFYNKVYNVRRNIINLIIIGISVIGIIICFLIVSNFQNRKENTKEGTLNIKQEVTISINEKYNKEIFFSQIENTNLDDITINYPPNFDITKPGKYTVTIKIDGKDYQSILNVIDTEKPLLTVKDYEINEGNTYTVNNFVTECTDNSNEKCILSFYNETYNQDGTKIDYSNYKEAGIYNIKISAKDSSDNETISDVKLTIKKINNKEPIKPNVEETCLYGNINYDKNKYVLTVPITNSNCAISMHLFKESSLTDKINKLMENETNKIVKEIDSLNLKGKFALSRIVNAILNEEQIGIVGYELSININITNDNETHNVVAYKVNQEGKRIFTSNPYNLSE